MELSSLRSENESHGESFTDASAIGLPSVDPLGKDLHLHLVGSLKYLRASHRN